MRALIGLLLLSITHLAVADCTGGWSSGDTTRQLVFTGLTAVDWAQTAWTAHHGQERNYYELNPALGDHPTAGRVNTYFLAAEVGHAAVSCLLPRGNWREAWQYVWIVVETQATVHNYRVGGGFSF